MKIVSPELLTLLGTRQFYCVDLFTFWGGNLGSTVLRYCAGDQDLIVNGFTYLCGGQTGPYFDRRENRAKMHMKAGMEVDTLVFDVIPGNATILTLGFAQALRYGVFDGASMRLEKCPMASYGDTRYGTIRQFDGRMGAIQMGRSVITMNVNSQIELLNMQLPRNLYSAACINTLGDKACGINQENFKTTGVVTTGGRGSMTASLSGSFPAGTFDQGKLIFTSGVLSTIKISVANVVFGSPNTINFVGYLPTVPTGGTTFSIYYGCDKSFDGANGCIKFVNLPRFKGFPRIPNPVLAV